ncbi:uncharacterized protein LOC143602685 [Bidens hawaiensis]|uniref:uncharacterized protein LOC143602685 n=1 Tax=Bidens hawaiensis TaxID=980011 RepID=UPI00404B9766
MRCKNHYTDLSSIVGVCATCLRERLIYLVAAQEQAQAQTLEDVNININNINPVFPRSVSPYITRRRSDNQTTSDANRNRNRNRNILPDRRFFSTPQLAPVAGDYNLSKKHKEIESDSDPRVSVSDPRVSVYGGGVGGCESATSAMSSPFRLRSGGGSRKTAAGVYRKQYCSDRGMSPVRYSDYGGVEDEFRDGSSGYETCVSRKQTPWRTPALRGGGGGGGLVKNVSGLSFCLSPLVRASPCRNWSVTAADGGGDVRGPVKAHLANTKSFCANRSRKLADFGRFNSNR